MVLVTGFGRFIGMHIVHRTAYYVSFVSSRGVATDLFQSRGPKWLNIYSYLSVRIRS